MNEHPSNKILLIEKLRQSGKSYLKCSDDELEAFMRAVEEIHPPGSPFHDETPTLADALINAVRSCGFAMQLLYERQARLRPQMAKEAAELLEASVVLAFRVHKMLLEESSS